MNELPEGMVVTGTERREVEGGVVAVSVRVEYALPPERGTKTRLSLLETERKARIVAELEARSAANTDNEHDFLQVIFETVERDGTLMPTSQSGSLTVTYRISGEDDTLAFHCH